MVCSKKLEESGNDGRGLRRPKKLYKSRRVGLSFFFEGGG